MKKPVLTRHKHFLVSSKDLARNFREHDCKVTSNTVTKTGKSQLLINLWQAVHLNSSEEKKGQKEKRRKTKEQKSEFPEYSSLSEVVRIKSAKQN